MLLRTVDVLHTVARLVHDAARVQLVRLASPDICEQFWLKNVLWVMRFLNFQGLAERGGEPVWYGALWMCKCTQVVFSPVWPSLVPVIEEDGSQQAVD